MKVIYFHQHFTTPALGGATRSYEFAKKMIAQGHEVTMVCGEMAKLNLPSTGSKGIFRGNVEGIDVVQIALPYSNNDSVMKRAFTFVKFAWKGIRLALTENYDLLFATSTPLTAGIPGIMAKWLRRKPFVFEVRDLWPELPKALGMKNPFLIRGMSFLEWLSYHCADACIGLSPGICEGIRKRSQQGKNIEMIPNGCDLGIFQPGERDKLVLEGIKPTDKVAIFTGAHGIANGLDRVLDMAEVLKKKGREDIKCVFIGDGKVKQALRERCKKENLGNCLFFDPMSKIQLNKIMSSADMGMMVLANVPAFYYGTSPNKFFDYISSGLPVINNYPGWLADLIRENECGEEVPPEDAEAFASSVIRLADDVELRRKYGKNARMLAERSFDREKLAGRFVAFLERVSIRK